MNASLIILPAATDADNQITHILYNHFTQAKNAFNKHLPHLSAIDLTKEREDNGTRLVFSTYALR